MHQRCNGFIAWWKFDQRRCRLHRLWENCDKILWRVLEQLLIFIVILVLSDVWVKLSCVFSYRSLLIISYLIRRSPVQWVTICPGITAAVTPTPLTCIILSDRYLDCRSHHLRGVNPDVSENRGRDRFWEWKWDLPSVCYLVKECWRPAINRGSISCVILSNARFSIVFVQKLPICELSKSILFNIWTLKTQYLWYGISVYFCDRAKLVKFCLQHNFDFVGFNFKSLT